MAANLASEISTTDLLSLCSLQAINLVIFLSSPFASSKFSKVFTNFFEETAQIGRKVTSNGLTSKTCSKIMSKQQIWKIFFIYFLVCLSVSFSITFQYFQLKEISMILKVDFGITYQCLLFISIPSCLVLTYPPSLGAIEFAMVFSSEFVTVALKKWKEDFKQDYEKAKFQLAKEEKDPAILRNSEQS